MVGASARDIGVAVNSWLIITFVAQHRLMVDFEVRGNTQVIRWSLCMCFLVTIKGYIFQTNKLLEHEYQLLEIWG